MTALLGSYAALLFWASASSFSQVQDEGARAAESAFAEAEGLRAQGRQEASRRAVELYATAEAGFERLGDRKRAAAAAMGGGLTHRLLSQNESALACYQRALKLREEISDAKGQAEVLNQIGLVYRTWGRLEDARASYGRALDLARAAGDRGEEGWALNGLGRCHFEQAGYQLAFEHYELALAAARAAGDERSQAYSENGLGAVLQSIGDDTAALPRYEQALVLRRRSGDAVGTINSLINVARFRTRLGDVRRAQPLLQEAIRLSRELGNRRTQASSLNALCEADVALKNLAQARGECRTAAALYAQVPDPYLESGVHITLGFIALQLGEAAESEAEFSRGLTLLEAARHPAADEAIALSGLARALTVQGRLDDARARADQAVALIESVRLGVRPGEERASFLAAELDHFDTLIDIAAAQHRRAPEAGHAKAAFRASEQRRARTLLDLLASEPGGAARSADEPGAQALEASQIQEALEPGTVLVEYALGEPRSHAWVLTAGDLTLHELAPRSVIKAAARRVHELLKTSYQGGDAAAEACRRLAELVLQPLGARLAGNRLLVVPDGALQYVPFAALPRPGARGAILAESHEVVVLPSASLIPVLRRARARATPERLVAVLADPVLDRSDARLPASQRSAPAAKETLDLVLLRSAAAAGVNRFARLPETGREAGTIAGLAGKDRAMLALGFDATRERALRPDLAGYRILHFATHALASADRPEQSGIVLSLFDERGRPRDGFLRLADIHQMRLANDLVVLSGCKTALGPEIRGEGLVGLARGFMRAGAPRVLAALWDVDDTSTAELMRRFYARLLGDGLTPAAALRAAQLSLRREPRHREAFHWAPFVLYGDWR